MSDINSIKELVGTGHYIDDPKDMQPYTEAWRGSYIGASPLIVFPTSTQQISQILSICHDNHIPVVPQGGNTGLVGGSTPDASNTEIVINLLRMNKVRNIDTYNATITVESGHILSKLNQTLEQHQLLFPLTMASEGSACVGGIISTNAGGTAVLRYGNMRQLVLGLEVVLPDGTIIDNLSGLRKNNTGYDLNQLFIGAEGTLGIVTAATLKLFPRPFSSETALVGLSDLNSSVLLLQILREMAEDTLTAFELIPKFGIELVTKHTSVTSVPLSTSPEWMILIDLKSSNPDTNIRSIMEQALEKAADQSLITDGIIAENQKQSQHVWALREHITEAEKKEGAMINFDISVPISSITDFIHDAINACEAIIPGIRAVPFGHVGDGNIHFNLLQPTAMDAEEFLSHKDRVKDVVYEITTRYLGSISAEHGIGRERKEDLKKYKSSEYVTSLSLIKKSFDPNHIMNPGRMIDIN
ncbi:MAG: FAD-binding oxidoreductase [Rickettsiales bacterium]|nr:FAD-binding oxidoreductase [Rickettsiales bacterium]